MNDRQSPADFPLEQYIELAVESELSQQQRCELLAAAALDTEISDQYFDHMAIHAQLRRELSAASLSPWPGELFPRENDGQPSGDPEPAAGGRQSASPVLGFLAGAWELLQCSPRALWITLGVLLGGYFVVVMALIPFARLAESNRLQHENKDRNSIPPNSDVGRLAAEDPVRWSPASPRGENARLQSGQHYQCVSGRLHLEFAAGARVCIDGPAEFEPQSGAPIRLLRGRLAAFVPPEARGFTVATPAAEVIDLGTEFGVEVDETANTELHVLKGEVRVVRLAGAAPRGKSTRVYAGRAVHVRHDGTTTAPIELDRGRFESARLAAIRGALDSSRVVSAVSAGQPIWLGNLFDDMAHTPLEQALHTDTFGAVPNQNTLGVERVLYGEQPDKLLGGGLKFDFSNIGWSGEIFGKICNDSLTVRDDHGHLGIQTLGKPANFFDVKLEEGISAHANSLICFSLNEIRAAGNLGNSPLVFACDRAGLDDHAMDDPLTASVHMAAIVSRGTSPLVVMLDGGAVRFEERVDTWSIVKSQIGPPLRANGQFWHIHLALPAGAEFLTLVTSAAGDGFACDDAVWSGARLEVAAAPSPTK